ncbi:MAG TPA: YajQ family cyclic di-GMP-binding protein [bacterium]|nr:YajQ family cyclic di-GMP-binding protein [bacterium]
MAAESSFDIVSRVDLQEVDNAVNQVKKEVLGRYDFKGSSCTVTLNRKENKLELSSDNKMRHAALLEILKQRLAKRGISLKSLTFDEETVGIDGSVKQSASLKMGIPTEAAKLITKDIRDSGIKVHAQIQDSQVRVAGKDKDELQKAIHLVKGKEYEVPLQFTNYR